MEIGHHIPPGSLHHVHDMPEEDDDHKFDLEVATVLSQGVCPSSSSLNSSPGKQLSKLNYSPFRPSTALTNITRGNFRTNTPCLIQGTLSLHQMAAQGELLLLQEELKCHDTNTREGNGFTPLIYAASHNQLRTLTFLLSQGGDPNLYGNRGETPLHFASAYGFDRAVMILLDAGADVNHNADDGSTALLYAAHQDQVECVEVLLEWGADLTALNPNRYTALEIAATQGYKHVQVAIERHLLSLLDKTD